jgi:hypothetical protein
MKKCRKCGDVKELSEFYKDKQSKDGCGSWCKTCSTSEDVKNRQRERHTYGRKVLRKFKLMKGCVHCGYKAHHAALEFNHRNPQEKYTSVASLANCVSFRNGTKSKNRIKFELSKCDVVCSICHSIITFDQNHQHGIQKRLT